MKKTLILWRDIPSQVIVQKGRIRGKAQLEQRFQDAIDRAAMRAGKGSSDAYLSEWRRETSSIDADGAPADIARAEASALEQAYTDDELLQLIRNHGNAGE